MLEQRRRPVSHVRAGYDFTAVSSVGLSLTRIPYLLTEVYLYNTATYKGVKNDFCLDWMPHMRSLGYELRALVASAGGGNLKVGTAGARQMCAQAVDTLAGSVEGNRVSKAGMEEANAFWVLRHTQVPPPAAFLHQLPPDLRGRRRRNKVKVMSDEQAAAALEAGAEE